jgi:undecaprenyl-diphosphatase
MDFDLVFSEWIVQLYYLSDFADFFGGRIFSGVLVFGLGVYFYKIKKFKIFLFICICTGFGDFVGNILKDLFAQPRPCYSHIQNFPMIEKCGPELTGLPSNHALNFFMFSALVHYFLKNPFMSSIFFGFSFLVSFSRVLLVKHWLSQVIIGGLIGIVLAKIFYKAYMRWKKS